MGAYYRANFKCLINIRSNLTQFRLCAIMDNLIPNRYLKNANEPMHIIELLDKPIYRIQFLNAANYLWSCPLVETFS